MITTPITITLQPEEVSDVLEALAHARAKNTREQHVLNTLHTQVYRRSLEEDLVTNAIQRGDLVEMQEIADRLEGGFWRFQLLTAIMEKLHGLGSYADDCHLIQELVEAGYLLHDPATHTYTRSTPTLQ